MIFLDLLKDVIVKILEKEDMKISFPELSPDISEIIETECMRSLQKINDILGNDSFSDFECIEEILRVFEDMGSTSSLRHDF